MLLGMHLLILLTSCLLCMMTYMLRDEMDVNISSNGICFSLIRDFLVWFHSLFSQLDILLSVNRVNTLQSLQFFSLALWVISLHDIIFSTQLDNISARLWLYSIQLNNTSLIYATFYLTYMSFIHICNTRKLIFEVQ